MTQESWGYSKENGPDRWHVSYPSARGNNQSPIAILTKNVHSDPILLPWFTGYDPGASKTIKNTGKTCRIAFDDTYDRAVLRAGPLEGIYRLRQIRIHWGSTDDKGSEHVVDLTRHAGEIHLVHWNSKYSNYNDALRKRDGVAVVALFMKVGKNPKPEMKRIIEEIDAVKTKDNCYAMTVCLKHASETSIESIIKWHAVCKGKEVPFHNFDPSILFPQNRAYFTYYGSFTTPPCEECVTWIILKEPIIVSSEQMEKFRSLSCNTAEQPYCPLVDNWRPLQPVNNRMVRTQCE